MEITLSSGGANLALNALKRHAIRGAAVAKVPAPHYNCDRERVIVPRRPATTQSCFPHPHLSDRINDNIIRSEIEGGVHLDDLDYGSTLEIETQNRSYRLVNRGGGAGLLSGHPQFCPQPVLVTISGSTWGGCMLKVGYVGRGMHLEFRHPGYSRPIITTRIRDLRQLL
jgi:hypothetical protein